ncbi:hypothetical protein E2C01_051907 [Portunus trituberculatus]|uniref:Uncharacterized protein n=1 Tax=Portunus trituberculatus TaxID=210409 RepID=A0A5B7GK44_PORTR|nr:hypothetical protein [Portunus trituberculatus]
MERWKVPLSRVNWCKINHEPSMVKVDSLWRNETFIAEVHEWLCYRMTHFKHFRNTFISPVMFVSR